MPKRPFYESAIHHLLLQLKRLANEERMVAPDDYKKWEQWINSFEFSYIDHETLRVHWTHPKKNSATFSIKHIAYYTRGDTELARQDQEKKHLLYHDDTVREKNDKQFTDIAKKLAKKAGIVIRKKQKATAHALAKIHEEEEPSDEWAIKVDPNSIDCVHTNTACTSPELRYIHKTLGNIKNKKLLDLGCGLGEASVYFALQGAQVTAVDLSQPMLNVVQAIAKRYKVKVTTLHASVEELDRLKKHSFDIIYVGNLFHHVNIEKTLTHVNRVLKPTGTLVCWEPVDYNPVINIYRKIARNVRSHDERPFRVEDIELFKKNFASVSVSWYWFTTLFIFVYMAIIQRRNPNKERFWKVVIKESESWKRIYLPLERLDRWLLKVFPSLGWLCWNTVLVCTKPRQSAAYEK